MERFQTLHYEKKGYYAEISFNRPDTHNALNDRIVQELLQVIHELEDDNSVTALVLKGKGEVFSSGSDLNWIKDVIDYGYIENLRETKHMQELFTRLYHLPMVTISYIQGACYGGANGFAAASDIVIAEDNTEFRFNEVNLGLVSATILPFVMNKMGESATRLYMLSGQSFSAGDAEKYGLVSYALPPADASTKLQDILGEIKTNSREATMETKRLINEISRHSDKEYYSRETAESIAKARLSKEGQEGMKAYLEQRKPNWRQ